MRDTFIPLDMIFIGPDGRVVNIVENAEPQSLQTRDSRGPVIAVLELAGGTSARIGLRAGDYALLPNVICRSTSGRRR